jgi:hypothetical protein
VVTAKKLNIGIQSVALLREIEIKVSHAKRNNSVMHGMQLLHVIQVNIVEKQKNALRDK